MKVFRYYRYNTVTGVELAPEELWANSRLEALEKINNWNRLGQGQYSYWLANPGEADS